MQLLKALFAMVIMGMLQVNNLTSLSSFISCAMRYYQRKLQCCMSSHLNICLVLFFPR